MLRYHDSLPSNLGRTGRFDHLDHQIRCFECNPAGFNRQTYVLVTKFFSVARSTYRLRKMKLQGIRLHSLVPIE